MKPDLKSYWPASSSITVMMILASEVTRELPAPPLFFGVFTFVVMSVFLYLVLRLDRD
jgi:hypothetical protein